MTATDDAVDGSRAALEDAREALRIERRRVIDEREAFRTFRGRVESVSTEATSPDGSSAAAGFRGVAGPASGSGAAADAGAGGPAGPPGSGLAAVRDAYAETVMSVPHYEEEYDDTYERSVAAEFGPELAYALTRSAGYHPEYEPALIDAVESAIEERDRLVERLEVEADSLDRAGSRLAAVRREIASLDAAVPDGGFGALDACRARAGVLVEDCDRIAARRQRVIAEHGRDLRLGDDVADLPTYLYQSTDATYPVLSAVGSIGDRLDDLTRRIERAMTRAR
ncbi:hypothetical protein DJ73_07965 [Halorubrum sp. Ea1]|uniref:DUF7260 family protein n=1 Tax=Halorubrum sp. Ea1 TaxID=1480718 RepID=UPI000B9847BF|nr:hypothetical protein [Halorubrum sp. Ea1]OYR53293.1 hypothetical protein DJ73_07965 [Halorubrum sp. Ea1]